MKVRHHVPYAPKAALPRTAANALMCWSPPPVCTWALPLIVGAIHKAHAEPQVQCSIFALDTVLTPGCRPAAQSVKDMPVVQDGPPPGGFPSVRYARRLPSTGPTGPTLFLVSGAIMAYGFYLVSLDF